MAIFNNMRITDKGKILYAKAQAGKELHFTKMRVGAGNVDSRNPDTLLDLIDPKYDVGIQSISPNSETKSATISGMINNGAVKEPTYICEIGLYAEDPDEGEILYGYASAGQYGDYYAPNTVGAFTWNYQVVAAIGNAANVTIELSSLVYDYGVINTTPSFIHLSGGNQKEINKSIDNTFTTIFNSGDYIYYCEASGSVNSYRVTIDEYTKKAYTKGMGIAVLINANSTGASTININGIGAVGIKKANGNNVTNLKAGSIYTMRYNGTNFILQGEGASGNAKSSDLLSGKTAESDEGELVGTIPIKSAQTYTPSASDQIIQAGQYLGGNQIIKGDSNLKPENIVQGKTIFGVEGSAITFSIKGGKLFKPADILTDFNIYSYNASEGWQSGLNEYTSLQVESDKLVGRTTRQDRYIRLDTNTIKLGVTSIDACILNNIDMVANKSVQVSSVQDIFTRLEMELSNGKYLIYFYGNYANTPRFADAIWYTTERPTHNGQLATSKIIDSKILENTDYKNHYGKAGYIKNNEKLTLFYDDNVYTYKNSALAGVNVVSLQIWYMASFANNLSQCSIDSIIIGG